MSDSENGKKHLVVSKEIHSRLKILAIQEEKDLQELTEGILKKALGE